jgi:hypothetical protein
MFIWLCGAPTSNNMHEKLKDPAFRAQVERFIAKNIHAYIPGIPGEAVLEIPKEGDLAWNRPINPDEPDFHNRMRDLERRVIRNQQLHTCHKATCLRRDVSTGHVYCKRNAPWDLSERAEVLEDGSWKPQRNHPFLNTYIPAVTKTGLCNNDGKFMTNGGDTKDTMFYTSKYMTKNQNNSYNASALLAPHFRNPNEEDRYMASMLTANKVMLFRCFISLNYEMEYSGPQVCTYLLGYGESIRSHDYATLYWGSVDNLLRRKFPEFARQHQGRYADCFAALLFRVTCFIERPNHLHLNLDAVRMRFTWSWEQKIS